MTRWIFLSSFLLIVCSVSQAFADEAFQQQIRPLLKEHCIGCHSTESQEGELDLERFTSIDEVREDADVWLALVEQVEAGEMPPKDQTPLSATERTRLLSWVKRTLDRIALANAGDPGEVILRRLSNVEYGYTIRDLTGIERLDPAADFPLDGAAGEGFTNAGGALVMSPTLLTRYIDAAKDVSAHAVLLPDSIRFSESTSSVDWANERLAAIREFYARYVRDGGATAVNLQGVALETNSGGRLPVGAYLAALQADRQTLASGARSIEAVAADAGLNEKYLRSLWQLLSEPQTSLLLRSIQTKWAANELTAEDIRVWQDSLWRLTSVGHIGKVNGPSRWQEPVSPLVSRHEMRVKLVPTDGQTDLVLYLATGDAGDGNEGDLAVWEQPRLVLPGQPDIPIRDVGSIWDRMLARRQTLIRQTADCLAAVDAAERSAEPIDVATLSARHAVDRPALAGWLGLLGITADTDVTLPTLLTRKLDGTADYRFIRGWVGDDALSVLSNSSDADVRAPGLFKAGGVVVHPSPTVSAVIAWRSPMTGRVTIDGELFDAHSECGNGVIWTLQHRRGRRRDTLASGTSDGWTPVKLATNRELVISAGDVIALVVGPRDGNHSCDTTSVSLRIREPDAGRIWDLASDVAPNILRSNPLPDSFGNEAVWHFGGEPAEADASTAIPSGSLLHEWLSTDDPAQRQKLADRLQNLLAAEPGGVAADSADGLLRRMLLDWHGPLFKHSAGSTAVADTAAARPTNEPAKRYGIEAGLFGDHPSAGSVAADSLCVQAPAVVELRLPADWVAGMEFVVSGSLHPSGNGQGSVQMRVLTEPPGSGATLSVGTAETIDASRMWTDNQRRTVHSVPVIVDDAGAARDRFEAAFDDFRRWFPGALCYTEIVPVDEVVTLTLYYREDDHLQRLMLDERETAELDRLWEELLFISGAPLKLVDAYEQLYQYATQDADPSAFAPLREPIHRAAAEYRQRMTAVEPIQLRAAIEFADQAWRRPLSESERFGLTALYDQLRAQELPHDAAIRMLITRILVAPAFLYRGEKAAPGPDPAPVDPWELATRLSYFLWSSLPDAELRQLADSGQLVEPEVLVRQVRRMTSDPKIRRLATEFGCQWLQVRDLDSLDEKSERHFPTFVDLRGDMQEEIVRFFIDLFQADRSVLTLLDSDHTFVNGPLARHYGFDIAADDWQRIDRMRAAGRGGILGFAGTLARHSGASRTSPILRGNWLSEVVLGERLPRPPKDVPVLPEEAPEGLTERQLIERHSSDPACAKCHQRIDPLGFALEGFDAIGRGRELDSNGHLIDTFTRMADGTELDGLEGLRGYLLETRRDDFLRQYCRKLLGYALGRSVQLSDKPLIDTMVLELNANGHRVGTVIEGIVLSPQFLMTRGQNSPPDD
ncbi:MAG: DUF1592 domain-containing protein [Planctomycetaceae bacterium]|nr:MAG: DUF1592 domain-containing protein [Planctomycetaceae bacterium]